MTTRDLYNAKGAQAAAKSAVRQTGQPIWRGSFDVNDQRASVARPFGDGSAKQAFQIIRSIRDAAFDWIKKTGFIVDEDGKRYKLRYELVRTLEAVLSFMKFLSGAITPTYEMIAKKAGHCRLTVIRHMKILRRLKIIDWVRRSQTGEDGQRAGQAANEYIFEISRLPVEMRDHLEKSLERQRLTLESHPERKGSDPVPNRAQRLAERLSAGFTRAMDRLSGQKRRDALMEEADFVRAEMEFFGDIPTSLWPALRHPDDRPAQEAYAARVGIASFDSVSNRNAPDSGSSE